MKTAISAAAFLGALAAAWTGGWYFLAQQAGRTFDGWIEDEQARDRVWTCGDRSVDGFPFGLNVNCSKPAFGSQFGPVRSADAIRLSASASVFSPFAVRLKIEGPLKLAGPRGAAELRWVELKGVLVAGGDDPDISLRGENLEVVAASGDAATWMGSAAKRFDIRVQRSPDRAPGSDALLASIDIDGAKSPPADEFFGSNAPITGRAAATILNARVARTGTLAERIDVWSSSGGRVQISSLLVEKGDSRLEASGELSLDEQRRATGRVSLRVAGIQPILSKLNLTSAPLAIEGLLRGSGRRAGGSSLLENRTLPVELRSGRLYIGPLRTPVLIPPLL